MTEFAFPPPPPPSVAVAGTTQRFPVHRIYCIGLNYADHVREMGNDPQAAPPVFFMKPADAVVANGAAIAYPSVTGNFHHEIELVVALARGGRDLAPAARARVRVRLRRRQRPDAPRPAGRGQAARPALGHRQGLRPVGAGRRHPPGGARARRRAGASG